MGKPSRTAGRQDHALVEAAWLYYQQGLNQNEIAARMQVSRATVVNHLNEARARGWVRVHLDSDVFREHHLADALCERFDLADAIVVPDDPTDSSLSGTRVIKAAAEWLPRLLQPGDRLGVSWGETVFQMAQHLPHHPIDKLTVVQLLGSRPATPGFAAEACTSLMALKLGGNCLNLHVPLLLSSQKLRDELCNEPVVADQLRKLDTCNKTVFACGTCADDAHIVRAGLLTAASMAQYRKKGAVGVVCGRLIDKDGQAIPSAVETRMIGISLDQMRSKDMSLLVVAGPDRTVAARAAIKGGFATHLATSTSIAQLLLEHQD